MPVPIIVSQGQIIQIDFAKTMEAFSLKVADIENKKGITEEASVLELNQGQQKTIKKSIQTEFLKIVAKFRINGFFSAGSLPESEKLLTKHEIQDLVNAENERQFRAEVRKLLGISDSELSDNEFDEMWCKMCIVDEGHAKRYREILSYPNSIIHSGTNSIQAKFIANSLKKYGVEVPKERLFLSFEHGCEYQEPNTLIHKIYQALNLKAGDKPLLIQTSSESVPGVFQSVSVERFGNQAKTAAALWPDTQVVIWNNKACNQSNQPYSLIRSLQEHHYISPNPTKIAYLMSSAGDTDLAMETIKRLESDHVQPVIIPLTTVAKERSKQLNVKNLERFALPEEALNQKQLDKSALEKIKGLINNQGFHYAYIGVPSPLDEEGAMQIAAELDVPSTVVFEYMYNPQTHSFWNHVKTLSARPNLNFAVPLAQAAQDVREIAPLAQVTPIGHLSIDRSFNEAKISEGAKQQIRANLKLQANDNLVFLSGSTQPVNVDADFIEAILSEITKNKYPHLQLRFGIHGGIQDARLDAYMQKIMEICHKYPTASEQFKIVINARLRQRLNPNFLENNCFIVSCEDPSTDIAKAADKVAQAVPGALINEAALAGKAVYIHQEVKTYLPSYCFAKSLPQFLDVNAKSNSQAVRMEALQVTSDAPANLGYLANRYLYK